MQVQRGAEDLRLFVIARQVIPDEGFHRPPGSTFRSGVLVNDVPSSPILRNFW
jgi:hypothetical protein